MRRVTNRFHLNKYSQFQTKNDVQVIEMISVPVVEEIIKEEIVIEQIIDNEVMPELTDIYEDKSHDVPLIEEIKKPSNTPSLKHIIEKIMLEKRLEKVNGWIFK
jgi:enamine deaminase RidA (YjgF/YER057c/UK114 family)